MMVVCGARRKRSKSLDTKSGGAHTNSFSPQRREVADSVEDSKMKKVKFGRKRGQIE